MPLRERLLSERRANYPQLADLNRSPRHIRHQMNDRFSLSGRSSSL